MLYNPHRDAPSFSSFEYWLETQDPSQSYPYGDVSNCACAQYLKAVGKFDDHWLQKSGLNDALTNMNRMAAGDMSDLYGNTRRTFGELLDRVRLHNRQAAPLSD